MEDPRIGKTPTTPPAGSTSPSAFDALSLSVIDEPGAAHGLIASVVAELFGAEEQAIRMMLGDWRWSEWGKPVVVRSSVLSTRTAAPAGTSGTQFWLESSLLGLGQAWEEGGESGVTLLLLVGDYLHDWIRPRVALPSDSAALAMFQPPLS